jgi:hypothetical protein
MLKKGVMLVRVYKGIGRAFAGLWREVNRPRSRDEVEWLSGLTYGEIDDAIDEAERQNRKKRLRDAISKGREAEPENNKPSVM